MKWVLEYLLSQSKQVMVRHLFHFQQFSITTSSQKKSKTQWILLKVNKKSIR